MNDLAGISSLPGGTLHVIDAIVGVTTPSSRVAENRAFQEVLEELTPIMEPDLLTYLHSNLAPGEYKILQGRDEYFAFLGRFTRRAEEVESNVLSVSGNDAFFSALVTISAAWAGGGHSSWQLCVVGRYNDARRLAELWLISSRDSGPNIDYSDL
jgi:hypothetical protein